MTKRKVTAEALRKKSYPRRKEELKTLKDLDLWFDDKKNKKKLKAEAIKWVKFYQRINEFYTARQLITIFNITSEDLK